MPGLENMWKLSWILEYLFDVSWTINLLMTSTVYMWFVKVCKKFWFIYIPYTHTFTIKRKTITTFNTGSLVFKRKERANLKYEMTFYKKYLEDDKDLCPVIYFNPCYCFSICRLLVMITKSYWWLLMLLIMGAGFQIGIITTQPLNIGASVPNLSISAPLRSCPGNCKPFIIKTNKNLQQMKHSLIIKLQVIQ